MSREEIVERLRFARYSYITVDRAECHSNHFLTYWGDKCLAYRKMLDEIDEKKSE